MSGESAAVIGTRRHRAARARRRRRRRASSPSSAHGGARVVQAHGGHAPAALGQAAWRVLWPPRREPRHSRPATTPASSSTSAAAACRRRCSSATCRRRRSARSRHPAPCEPPYAVVKVAHHGSADQDAGLYRRPRPTVALVTVGVGNDYGHPRDETLAILAELGATVIAHGPRRASSRCRRAVGGVGGLARARRAGSAPVGRLGDMASHRAPGPCGEVRAAPSRSCRGGLRSRRRSCSSRVPRRSAPSARSPACGTTCAPRTRASRSPTSAPTTTPRARCWR